MTRPNALAFVQERHALLFQSEALQPQFDCEQTPIDWDHIGMIALMMAEAAHQGWRGTYRLNFRYRAQGDVMTAALKVPVWSWRLKKATPPLCISREGRMCRPIAANSLNVTVFPAKGITTPAPYSSLRFVGHTSFRISCSFSWKCRIRRTIPQGHVPYPMTSVSCHCYRIIHS